jgi:hypothetical protein
MNALLQLEKPLIDLKNMAGLLGHLSTSEREATGQELEHIRVVLLECHEDLESWWDDACHKDNGEEHEQEEVAALKAELAACKASYAPPGSEADAERSRTCWWLLISAARTVIEEAKEAGTLPVAEAGGQA